MSEERAWRMERDSLGEVRVPSEVLYGAQTQRAVENFPVSGLRPDPTWIVATAVVKQAAAEVNMALGQLEPRIGRAIVQAAEEIVAGQWHDQFVVDLFQAGAGTSHNMNANEVIANRAGELLGEPRGTYHIVHPNDHVNMAQSTNDVIPTVIRVSALMGLRELLPILRGLASALQSKAREFDHIVKAGRTHLQDAVPVRLGQEFGAYAQAVVHDTARLEQAADSMKRIGVGGTATGTGLNSDPDYHPAMVKRLSELTQLDLHSSGNLFESMQSMADPAHLSAALRTLAVTLDRIANDLRLMSSGPRTGLAEIRLPAVQPGSSIMPGKVNPVMAEMLNMVCFQVMGNDLTIMLAAQAGQLELNVMMPLIGHNLLSSILILSNGVRVFTERCVRGIEADEEHCRAWVEGSMGIGTALNPYIGYDAASKVVREAMVTGKSIRQIVRERALLNEEELHEVLSPRGMTEPKAQGKRLP
jgi:fumarate hydratase class II